MAPAAKAKADAASDDEAKPTKEPRMTTNKKKRANYYSDANIKNRRTPKR